ncbi:hypothetical protein J2752_000228 [Halarchaeum rubridurum]|uniref:DUF8048 domain-containing protein n=1 Tax=Halarchaeum rubridurum TaxID=489911 RepID=A0A830FZ12_9EURY|nr:hypothetical protein [Halarchaeum rubridurum]MBP1953347.1 hypothetical protein [Halarchaeum rubridurum]GGM66027.1 hypothetical protein GCM10009017_15110 [Halarchaeum rubridurum]
MDDDGDHPVSTDAVEEVSAARDVSADRLDAALAALQDLASDSPGVESVADLVYEWRNAFRDDPLVERTAEAYYLTVDERVWRDFAERLDWESDVREAVRAAHRRALAAALDEAVGGDDDSDGAGAADGALVLGR